MIEDKISIIVPVYNVENYLHRCVDSLITQTYDNIEIILVNDGSSDHCPEICDNFSRKDSRVRVIHKLNGGLSDARNIGIERSTGKYLAFVDSDDWVDNDFVEKLYSNIKREDADISIIGYKLVWENGKTLNFGDSSEYNVYTREEAIKELLKQKKFQCMVCQKMYKREIFNDVKFPVGEIYEDVAVSLPTFLKADKVVFSGHPKYYYFQRNDSIVNEKFSEKKLYFLESCKEIIEYSDRHEKIYDKEAHSFYLKAILQLIFQLYLENNQDNEEITRKLENEIRKNINYIYNNNFISIKRRILLFLIYIKFPRNIIIKILNRRLNT